MAPEAMIAMIAMIYSLGGNRYGSPPYFEHWRLIE